MIRTILAFPRKEWRLARSYKFALVLNLGSILFGVVTFFFVGRLFGAASSVHLAQFGGDYFPYVLVGIATSTFLVSTLNGLANSLRREQDIGTLEAILVTPVPHWIAMFGLVLWHILFALLISVTYILLGSLFTPMEIDVASLPKAAVVLVLSALTFLSLGVVAASFILYFKRGNPITWIFSSLSILLGGVYFPVEILPRAIQPLSKWIPLTYAINLLRKVLLQDASWSALTADILILLLFTAISVPIAIVSLNFFLGKTRREGSLGHQ